MSFNGIRNAVEPSYGWTYAVVEPTCCMEPVPPGAECGDLEENGGEDSYEMPPVSGFITVSATSPSTGDLTWTNLT